MVLDSYEDYTQKGKRTIYTSYLLGCNSFHLMKGTTITPFQAKPGEITNLHSIQIKLAIIKYKDLPSSLQDSLGDFIQTLVKENEKKFVNFFNTAKPITTRLHSLKLLPGVGTKRMWSLIETRKTKQFENFDDLAERGGISDPVMIIAKRILQELQGNEKYLLFLK
ncbi:MAG: DUF655 domain-containing protein [Candidatus Hodarchaeales archaeon]